MVFRAALGTNGSTVLGAILAIPLFIIFVIIAFFEVSEMGLIQFLAKLVKTYFFDTPKKFQVNYSRINQMQVNIQEFLSKQQKKIIDIKEHALDEKIAKKLKNKGLLD
jgi:predicted transcriptional regulator YheO